MGISTIEGILLNIELMKERFEMKSWEIVSSVPHTLPATHLCQLTGKSSSLVNSGIERNSQEHISGDIYTEPFQKFP